MGGDSFRHPFIKIMKLKENWSLYYYDDGLNLDDYKSQSCFKNVVIPTMFELEIYRNGLLGNPYESTNSWLYQKYESYHQVYVCRFKSNKKRKYLKINGIDTISEIYVNGKLVGTTNNMFIPYTFELNNLKEDNELLIHILPAVLEGQKFKLEDYMWAFKYNYEGLYIRKSASSFGWDILPRTPLGGIYKDIELLDKLPLIKDVHIWATDINKEKATLHFDLDIPNKKQYRIEISGNCGKKHSFSLVNKNKITIKNPMLWHVRNFGKPNLYQIKIAVYKDDKLVESKVLKYGIRKVELKRSSVVQEGGCFEFYINDEKVFLLGSNWVPIDAIKHVDDEMMLKTLDMLVETGANAIRIWGGGTYETDLFYEKCDELGIFVWQDFMMGCAVYPRDDYFKALIREETEYIVKHLRNHPCICLWAGDNENDLATMFWAKQKLPAHTSVLTRQVIPEVLERLDQTRPYLPSSPYYDQYVEAHPKEVISEDHLWGPRDYFKGEFYSNAKPYFTSETGYHAMCGKESAMKFLKKPWPIFDMDKVRMDEDGKHIFAFEIPTKEYMCHAVSVKDDLDSPFIYRIPLMYNQVITLFKNKIDNLDDFIEASQISQGEAMKYFIERMRKDYKRNGGIIWWNIKDGWPQPSDAIVDWYFSKKKSYYYIKNSQQRNLLMMNEEDGKLNLYCVSSDDKPHTLKFQVIDAYKNELLELGTIRTKPRDSFIIKDVKADDKTLLVILYTDEKGNSYVNHFHTHIIDIDSYQYLDAIKRYKLFD